jgi:hypothetical protein
VSSFFTPRKKSACSRVGFFFFMNEFKFLILLFSAMITLSILIGWYHDNLNF